MLIFVKQVCGLFVDIKSSVNYKINIYVRFLVPILNYVLHSVIYTTINFRQFIVRIIKMWSSISSVKSVELMRHIIMRLIIIFLVSVFSSNLITRPKILWNNRVRYMKDAKIMLCMQMRYLSYRYLHTA